MSDPLDLTLRELLVLAGAELRARLRPDVDIVRVNELPFAYGVRRAIRVGELDGYKLPGDRSMWVDRDELNAWCKREGHRVPPPSSRASGAGEVGLDDIGEDDTDDVAAVLAFNQRARR
jgi:hypothetical protein